MIYTCFDVLRYCFKRISFPDYNGRAVISGLVYFFIFHSITAQDTQPPVILIEARDTSFLCNTNQDLTTVLTEWYNNAAGAVAEDDSGQVFFNADLSLQDVIDIFNASSDMLCGNTRSVTVSFTASDPSGNTSYPTTARFFTYDDLRPALIIPPNISTKCVSGIRDTLIRWIQNRGGYQATDNCSQNVIWTIYQYSITTGGNVIQSGGGSIANGPYPTIPDGVCNWRVNINFFVQDECGNQIITPATTNFTVVDDIAPEFTSTPQNVTVSCDSVPAPFSMVAMDACTQNVSVQFSESHNQNPDPASCEHYNYIITRNWIATDNCGNSTSYTQVINVVDDVAPEIQAPDEITILCTDLIKNPDSMFITSVSDKCSPAFVVFTDGTPTGLCNYSVTRTYQAKDVCGNESTRTQIVNINTRANPVLESPSRNRTFSCDELVDFQTSFFLWVNDFGGARPGQSCSLVKSFAAVPGSYNPSDTLSFPGISPGGLNAQQCPSGLSGFLRYESVDFVFYDLCGNVTVSNAIFGIKDTLSPVILNCPQAVLTSSAPDDCMAVINLFTPDASEDCLEVNSPVTRIISRPVLSANPGNNESVVDSVTLRIGPFNPNTLNILSDAAIELEFRNLDIDDTPEFFRIKDEDGVVIGRSPTSTGQCASAAMTLTLDKNKVVEWIQDGFIDLHFIPNVIPDNPVLSINDICSNSSIRATISFEIDIENAINRGYAVNAGNFQPFSSGENLSLLLPVGSHQVVFRFEDCASNISECIVPVEIEDKSPPVILCPDDVTLNLAQDSCTAVVSLDTDFSVTENCQGNRKYDRLIPPNKESALLSFIFNESSGNYIARSRQFIFPDVFPKRYLKQDAILEVEIFGDIGDDGEVFEIFGSDGSWIGNTILHGALSTCGLSKTVFRISHNTFNSWIENGNLSITAVPKSGPSVQGGGINPCRTLMSGQITDGESYLQMRLFYTDASFSASVSGATVIDASPIPLDVASYTKKLSSGENIINITTKDNSGNNGQCSYKLTLRDIQKPVARCKNFTVSVSPSGIDPYSISLDDIDNGSYDNCKIDEWRIEPAMIDCTMLGDRQVKLYITDSSGNQDSCIAQVLVRTTEVRPGFSSGLCQNDTLKLFANPPPSSVHNVYAYKWQGPNGIEFFEENPFIPNVTAAFNGLYQVTVTGFNGCSAEGSVLVNIQPLTNPVLTVERDTICEGDDVILRTTAFTGNITYEWYEGVFPNGILLQITQSPDISLRPAAGVHFFYVIAQGEGCRSNASSLVRITALRVPQATVNNIFLTPCEGEEIKLGTSVTGTGFTYQWTGPAGYAETGQFPRVIQNVQFIHSGIYRLVIFNRLCNSDTAITNVQVLERPPRPVIASAEVFCQGSTFNLLATNSPGADSYDWYRDNTLFRTTAQNSLTVPNAQIVLQGSWYVVAVRGNCRSEASEIKNIGIINILEIGATNSGPACEGDSIRLQATFVPNASYKWSGPIPDIPSVQNPLVPAIAGEYSVTITTATLCANNASTTVQVISKPQITAVSNSAMPCMDGISPITFSPSVFPPGGNYSYEWTFNNSIFSTERNPVISNAMLSDTGLYTLRVFNQNCASSPMSTRVNFNVNPPQPAVIGELFYCAGDTFSLVVVQQDNITRFIWNTPLGTVETTQQSLQINNASTIHNGSYSVSIISGDCTSIPSEPFVATVRPKPVAPALDTSATVCFGSDIVLTAPFQADVRYNWTGPDFVSMERTPLITNATQANSGIYRLRTELNGCLSANTSETEVIVLDKIEAPEIIDGNFTLCADTDSKVEICLNPLSGSPGTNTQLVHAVTGNILAEGNAQCYIISASEFLLTGVNLFYAVATKDNCTSERSANNNIRVSAAPDFTAGVIDDNITVCPGDFVTLVANHGPPDVELSWTSPDPELNITFNTARSVLISNLKNGTNVILLNYSVSGCVNFSTDTVNVQMEFMPVVNNDNYEIIYNQHTELNILANDIIPGDFEIILVTEPKHGRVVINQRSVTYIPDPRFTDDVSFVYRICGLYCDNLCAEATVFLNVRDAVDCFGPNVITPNRDGYNDSFVVPCLSNGNFPGNQLYVFNQWGAQVYHAAPYKNDWEGTHGGNPLPAGTYFYVLDLGDGTNPLNGFLILQR